jgi:hypothetical protein
MDSSLVALALRHGGAHLLQQIVDGDPQGFGNPPPSLQEDEIVVADGRRLGLGGHETGYPIGQLSRVALVRHYCVSLVGEVNVAQR